MLKSYKTEIDPTPEQKILIHKTIGTCRFVYNLFLDTNRHSYEEQGKYISGMAFSKWLNNTYIPEHPEKAWLKEVSSKAVKQSIMNADRAYRNFFAGRGGFPAFKKKARSDVKMYFVKNDVKTIIPCERHRIRIPTLGWVRLKEKGYIPTDSENYVIKSGTVSMKAGRYYVSVLVLEPDAPAVRMTGSGLGIDLGLKDYMIISDGTVYENINKTDRIRKLEKQLKRQQRSLSRKYGSLKKREKGKKKGEATRQNIQKQKLKVQKLHQRLDNIRSDYVNQCISKVVKTKPSYITLEDLNVSGMMKNRHLSKAIASQKLFETREKLSAKCKQNGIELRIVSRWYPSSKKCHACGRIKKELKLTERTYICPYCGYRADRDFNASRNLRDAEEYTAVV